MKKPRQLEGINRIKEEFSKEEMETLFNLFNNCFQLEFMIFELGFLKLESVFRYVHSTNKLIRKFFLKELGIKNYPKIGIELLLNRSIQWEKVARLERKYGIQVTSIHAPLDYIHDSILGKLSGKVFRGQLKENYNNPQLQQVIKSTSIPITVHASQFEIFKKCGLARDRKFRIENDSVSKTFSEKEKEMFCCLEEVIKKSQKHKAGLVFDTYHFYTYQCYLKKKGIPRGSKIRSVADILKRDIILGDKFHLSEGKNGGRGLTDRHMALTNSRGKIDTKKFLKNYNFYQEKKNYLTLEINPLERGARMIPHRVRRYYAKNFIFLIDCLVTNLLKNKYGE